MKTDDLDVLLLNYIYQNAEMGVIAINDIFSKIESAGFRKLVEHMQEEYQKICEEAIEIFIKYGKSEKEIGLMPKILSYIMSNVKTAIDKSDKHIAKMLVEGSNKGIVEIQEKINANLTDDTEMLNLAKKLLEFEENNLKDLKEYL